jgi:hypothetical protein
VTDIRKESDDFIEQANGIIKRAKDALPGATEEQKEELRKIIEDAEKLIGDKRINEAFEIGTIRNRQLFGLSNNGISPAGAVFCNAISPVAWLGAEESCMLTFQFIDTTSQLPVSGPEIGSVFYEVNIDPDTPDVFVTLGTSFDASSNFALSFLPVGFEPEVHATPYDLLGNPIIVLDQNGLNVAPAWLVIFPLPDLSRTDVLLPLSVLSLAAFRRIIKPGR